MQYFPCPFCGLRPETEFHFVAEAGKERPATATALTDADWASYLYDQRNEKGLVREIWMHLPCGELFLMERDSVTMEVIRSVALREGAT